MDRKKVLICLAGIGLLVSCTDAWSGWKDFKNRHNKDGKAADIDQEKKDVKDLRDKIEKKDLGTRDPGVNRRQAHQASRIARGVKYGSLTKEETKYLVQKEKDLAALEQQLKGDGQLTKDERVTLHKELNELSKEIFDEKHDSEVRGPDTPRNIAIRNRLGTGALSKKNAANLVGKIRELRATQLKLNDTQNAKDREELEKKYNNLVDDIYDLE